MVDKPCPDVAPRNAGCRVPPLARLAAQGRRMKKVVARYRDGRVIKGVSLDVSVDRPVCHVQQADGDRVPIALADLKALFFVRSLEGNPQHHENLIPEEGDPRSRGLTPVRVVFEDGEVIVGLTIRYPPNKPFFFLVPVDTASNNIRILVNGSALVSMEAHLIA